MFSDKRPLLFEGRRDEISENTKTELDGVGSYGCVGAQKNDTHRMVVRGTGVI
jgi:hypothetical protein